MEKRGRLRQLMWSRQVVVEGGEGRQTDVWEGG